MSKATESPSTNDPYQLSRFVRAQQDDYEQALYAIKSIDEARTYLAHPVLGPRLLECAEAVVRVEGRSAREIFGSPDDLKLRSCATLFACVSPPGSVFAAEA